MIRFMNINDINRVADIERKCFKDAPSPLSFDEIAGFIIEPTNINIIDEDSGAYLIISPIKTANAVYIHRVAIPEDKRGNGVFKSIALYAGKVCSSYGYTSALLHVAKENIHAIDTYKNLGFRPIMEALRYYPSGKDALTMQKTLHGMKIK